MQWPLLGFLYLSSPSSLGLAHLLSSLLDTSSSLLFGSLPLICIPDVVLDATSSGVAFHLTLFAKHVTQFVIICIDGRDFAPFLT